MPDPARRATSPAVPRPAATAHGRLLFADQLRGLACLAVIVVHYLVVFPTARPLLAWVLATPRFDGEIPDARPALGFGTIDFAAFGVALFFLISGFLIPASLERGAGARFVAQRFLRIFPTYWAALAICWLVVAADAAWWHRAIVFGPWTFAENLALVHTTIGGLSVDLVNWTLAIELKFYLLMLLLAGPRGRLPLGALWALPPVLAGLAVLSAGAAPAQLRSEAVYLCFFLPGVALHAHLRGRLRVAALLAFCVWAETVGLVAWHHAPTAPASANRQVAFVAALAAFAIAYAARARIPDVALLRLLAAISYPLYLVHVLLGFSVTLAGLEVAHLPWWPSAFAGIAASVLVASALHLLVERPAIRLGRRLTSRSGPRPASPSWRGADPGGGRFASSAPRSPGAG